MIGDMTNNTGVNKLTSLEDLANMSMRGSAQNPYLNTQIDFVLRVVELANSYPTHIKLRALKMLKNEYPEEFI